MISGPDCKALDEAYAMGWALQCATRLLSASPIGAETLGQAGAGYLCRALGRDTLAGLETQMAENYDRAEAIIAKALAGYESQEGPDAEG